MMQISVLSELKIHINNLFSQSIQWFLRQWQWEITSNGVLSVQGQNKDNGAIEDP